MKALFLILELSVGLFFVYLILYLVLDHAIITAINGESFWPWKNKEEDIEFSLFPPWEKDLNFKDVHFQKSDLSQVELQSSDLPEADGAKIM